MIPVTIHSQPNDETCGPTSLHAVYNFYGDKITLTQLLREVQMVKTGGTIAAHLANHALARGYKTTMYVYNLNVFDLTWFDPKTGLADSENLINKLIAQRKYLTSKRTKEVTDAYVKMLKLGGKICFSDLSIDFLHTLFSERKPVITGLSATYLYQSAREWTNRKKISIYDDVRGDPTGHFVVLCGYDNDEDEVVVADPLHKNPISGDNYYQVSSTRLINSIMLGVLTYDSNLLIISPGKKS